MMLLIGSTGRLLDHLDNCNACRWDGTKYCEGFTAILEMVRHDRKQDVRDRMGD